MANTDLDRGSRVLTQKSKRYSIFSLARNAASYHQNWQQAALLMTGQPDWQIIKPYINKFTIRR